MAIEGPTFLLVHSPCPLGWGHAASLTVEVGRLAVQSGLQTRFRHLFGDDPRALEEREHLQALADHNIAIYGLAAEQADPADADGADTVCRGGVVS